MKYCIVNADDFGATSGINRGIVEAHRNGIVTSASLMVNEPGAAEAAAFAGMLPRLSVGLHVNLPKAMGMGAARAELAEQWRRFETLTGRPPTHLDAHHNTHRDPQLAPLFAELAHEKGAPLREHGEMRYFSAFYGRWGGESHPGQIGVENLLSILVKEIRPGFTELSCHPGYVSADLHSDYRVEREIELATLCDSRVAQKLVSENVHLINYRDYALLRSRPEEARLQ